MPYVYRAGVPVTIQEEEREQQRLAQIERRERQDAESLMYGWPDEELPQEWMDRRPHAVPWLRKWID